MALHNATKIDENTWRYRGFTISRNFKSPNGTGVVCKTQRGVSVTPYGGGSSSSGIYGDWNRSVSAACENIDYYFRLYDDGGLSRTGRAIIEEAIRLACERGESVSCPDAHLCRHGIDA
jgi:hypothetical protein